MALALNKSSLKQQRDQLSLFRKFLPSLDLKRQQLLGALKEARGQLEQTQSEMERLYAASKSLFHLLGSATLATRDLSALVHVNSVRVEWENLAGVRLPVAREVNLENADYSTLATPFWIDPFIDLLRQMAELTIRRRVNEVRVERLSSAGRRVTQRVNLFEKVLIPQAQQSIRRIQIFLADQERSAVVRSKIAKTKH